MLTCAVSRAVSPVHVYRTRLEADVAQLVEQLIRNQQVSGSNPLVGSSMPSYERYKIAPRVEEPCLIAVVISHTSTTV